MNLARFIEMGVTIEAAVGMSGKEFHRMMSIVHSTDRNADRHSDRFMTAKDYSGNKLLVSKLFHRRIMDR